MTFIFSKLRFPHPLRKTNYQNYDEALTAKIMMIVDCVAPYWKSNQSFARCKSKDQMKAFSNIASGIIKGYIKGSKYILQPCLDLQKLMFDFEEQDVDIKDVTDSTTQQKLLKNESYTHYYISLTDVKFKEIK